MLTGCLAYLLAHLAAYLLVLRHVAVMRTEKGIFLYHFLSFCAFVAALVIAGASNVATAVTYGFAAAAAHGIYSMSFLELWSLSQGSYSFTVLSAIKAEPQRATQDLVAMLSRTGDGKRVQRLASLQRLGLIREENGQVVLTTFGGAAAAALRGLRWLANLRDTG